MTTRSCLWRGLLAGAAVGVLAAVGVQHWRSASRAATRLELPPEPVSVDASLRLSSYPGKEVVPCPAQDGQTAVLVVAGQSNAGNSGALRYAPRHGHKVLNYFNGRCFVARSPLLGAEGRGGDYWGMLADRLIDQGMARQVVLAPFAVGGSRVVRWRLGGDLHEPFLGMLKQLGATYRPTRVLWHQGESDFLFGTTQAEYASSLKELVQALRSLGVEATFHVAVSSRCLLSDWRADGPVAKAQRSAADDELRVKVGPDADAVWGEKHRFDDCHLSGDGQLAMAERWLDALR